MNQIFYMCSILGEPLSQTAQAFMPGLITGVNRSFDKVRTLISNDMLINFFYFLEFCLRDTTVATPTSFS